MTTCTSNWSFMALILETLNFTFDFNFEKLKVDFLRQNVSRFNAQVHDHMYFYKTPILEPLKPNQSTSTSRSWKSFPWKVQWYFSIVLLEGRMFSVHGLCTAFQIWEPFHWKAPLSFSKSGTQMHDHMYLNFHIFWRVQCRRTPIFEKFGKPFQKVKFWWEQELVFSFSIIVLIPRCTSTWSHVLQLSPSTSTSRSWKSFFEKYKILFKSQMFQYLIPCTTIKIILDFDFQ